MDTGNTFFTDKLSSIITQDDMVKAIKMKEMMKKEMMDNIGENIVKN